MDRLEQIDRYVFFKINGFNSNFADEFMWQVSHQWVWIPLFLFFTFYAFKKLPTKGFMLFLIGVGLCFLFADQISVQLFKETFQRHRPSHNLEIKSQVHLYTKSNGEIYYGGLYGFVSSHAANFFALSTFLFLVFRTYSKKWVLIFLWATLIIYSRVYLGVHYPSDVLCGALLGGIIGYLIFKLFNFTSTKFLKPNE